MLLKATVLFADGGDYSETEEEELTEDMEVQHQGRTVDTPAVPEMPTLADKLLADMFDDDDDDED